MFCTKFVLLLEHEDLAPRFEGTEQPKLKMIRKDGEEEFHLGESPQRINLVLLNLLRSEMQQCEI